MKIERVDDKTVKCFLSLEELEEYQIDYKDFIMRSEKAKEVVQEIIQQAEEEVGYKPPKFAFDLQIMMVPDQGMVLTFSEKELPELENPETLTKCLTEMKKILEEAKERVGEAKNKFAENADKLAKKKDGKEASQKIILPENTLVEFASIGKAMEYASAVPKNLRVASMLYTMNDSYYIYISRNRASLDRYTRACIQSLEFGRLFAASDEQLHFMQEHGECLIEQGALKKLSLN